MLLTENVPLAETCPVSVALPRGPWGPAGLRGSKALREPQTRPAGRLPAAARARLLPQDALAFPGQVHPHTGTARGVAASGGEASPRGPFSQGLPKGLRAALSLYGFISPEGIPSVTSKSLRAKPRRGKELAFSSVRNTGGPVCVRDGAGERSHSY